LIGSTIVLQKSFQLSAMEQQLENRRAIRARLVCREGVNDAETLPENADLCSYSFAGTHEQTATSKVKALSRVGTVR
jgi:hypothetical protein